MDKYKEKFAPFLTGEMVGNDNVAYCPVHENPNTSKKPSAQINFSNKIWFCFVCIPESDDATLAGLAAAYDERLAAGDIDADILPGTDEDNPGAARPVRRSKRPPVNADMLTSWADALNEVPARLAYLTDERRLKPKTVAELQIGYSNLLHRFTIPVHDADGNLIDARCRSNDPESTTDKYIWWHGGATPLFNAHRVDRARGYVILMEGELDSAVAHQDKLPAVSGTAGAGTWKNVWTAWFTGLEVFICYDGDKAGRKGRSRASKALLEVAAGVYLLDLDGHDYTSWRMAGHTVDEFRDLIEAARLNPVAQSAADSELPTNGEQISLSESQNAERNGKPIELNVSVMGKTEPAYNAPKRVEFYCDQDKGTSCKTCPMNELYDGKVTREYKPNSDVVRNAIDGSDDYVRKMLRADIKAKCSDRLEIARAEDYSVEDLLVTDTIESKRRSNGSDIVRNVYVVGTYDTPVNTEVRIVGEQVPGRRDQRGQLHSWLLEQVQSNIDSFVMTPAVDEAFRAFQPAAGQSPLDKAFEIAEDQAHHVTSIYGRGLLHVAYALSYHSLLAFRMLGTTVKGTLELAVPGDSRTGKSATIEKLQDHYRCGTIVACDLTSLAGLIGGMQQPNGKNWVISWGTIPQHDRRQVTLDEAQSLKDKGIIENMSSVRSSGIAQIAKIRTARTTARVRLIWIFNPPNGAQLASHAEGAMQAVRDLMPAHEDIARFDLVVPVGRDEVPSTIINARDHGDIPQHRFTSDLEAAHVLWAWSRKDNDVVWAKGAEDYLLRLSEQMGRRYTPEFPLIQAENVREKLARGAVALAALTYSVTANGEKVLVRKVHIADYCRFLNMVYSGELMGYLRMSDKRAADEVAALANIDQVKAYFLGDRKLPDTEGPRVAQGLMSVGGRFESRTLAEASSSDISDVIVTLRWLEDMRMIRRIRGGRYVEPVPALTALLREIESESKA